MTLFDYILKVYTVPVRCTNCDHKFELKIPKGKKIEDFLKSEACRCDNCACATLVKINI